MVYIEYEAYKRKYHEAQSAYDELLTVKSSILSRKAYHRELKKIASRIDDVQQLLKERELLLSLKLDELKGSNDPTDKVYYLRYIEHLKVKKISAIVHYSDTQVYRILNTITETLTLSQHGRE